MGETRTYSVITGAGVHIPDVVVPNSDFLDNEFFDRGGNRGGNRISSPFQDRYGSRLGYSLVEGQHHFFSNGKPLMFRDGNFYNHRDEVVSPFLDNRGVEIGFDGKDFWTKDGKKGLLPTGYFVAKLEEISGIRERRYVPDGVVASDIAILAGKSAMNSAGIRPESIDEVVVTHYRGDIRYLGQDTDVIDVKKIKEQLGVASSVMTDFPRGCTGWLDALIYVDKKIKMGKGHKYLVIATDTLQRVLDPHDVDSMLFGSTSGAAVVEARESFTPIGIIGYATHEDKNKGLICMGPSNNPERKEGSYIKMNMGKNVHEYVINNCPGVIQQSIEAAETLLKEHELLSIDGKLTLEDFRGIVMHQANGKINEHLFEKLSLMYHPKPDSVPRKAYRLMINQAKQAMVPMTIEWIGNSSGAAVATLFGLLFGGDHEFLKQKNLYDHRIRPGKYLLVAVGADMVSTSIVYRVSQYHH
ncbi:MAG: hypothetical protein AABX33_05500 [Nanoarchaeota archaeon]